MQLIAKVNSPVEITYKAKGDTSGLTDVTMVIYDEGHTLDGVNFPDVIMTELGSTGVYYGSFTPDAVGVWTVVIDSVTKSAPLTQNVAVTNNDLDSLGTAIGDIQNPPSLG